MLTARKRKRKTVRETIAPRRIPEAGPLGVAMDTETTGLHLWTGAAPFAFSFVNEWGDTGYFEFPVDPFTRRVVYDADPDALACIHAFACDPSIRKVWFNGKFDRTACMNAMGVTWAGPNDDAMHASHVCNSDEPRHDMKSLADKYLGVDTRDQNALVDLTKRARTNGKSEGYMIATKESIGPSASHAKADYWLPAIVFPEHGDVCERYAVIDAERTMGLWLMYRDIMDEHDGWRDVYDREMELEPAVERMERRGVGVSLDRCRSEWNACEEEKVESLAHLRERSGDPEFKCTDNDVRKLVYETLGHAVTARTEKTKQPSVAQGDLVQYSSDETVQSIFRYKIASKGQSAFFENYMRMAVPDRVTGDGHELHPSFFQSEARTGRFSCRNPALQQVPDAISTRAARPIQGRGPFGPRPGCRWFLFDYQQLESRIFAGFANEKTMIEAFASGRDLHTETANKAWGGIDPKRWPTNPHHVNPAGVKAAINALGMDGITVGGHDVAGDVARMQTESKRLGWIPWDEYKITSAVSRLGSEEVRTKYQSHMDDVAARWLMEFNGDIVGAEKSVGKKNTRAKAKMVLFARTFGGGPNAIKDLMYVSREEAADFLHDFSIAFPDIETYIDQRTNDARRDGGVHTAFGRFLTVAGDKPYKGVNYTVQGSAADLMKIAMIRVDGLLRHHPEWDAHIVMTIHDELIIEAPRLRRSAIRQIIALMEDSMGCIPIPTPVDVERATERWTEKTGLSWLAK